MKKYFLIKGGIRLESDICICNIRRSLNVYVKIIALRNSSYLTVPSSCLKLSITPSSEEDRVWPRQARMCFRSPPFTTPLPFGSRVVWNSSSSSIYFNFLSDVSTSGLSDLRLTDWDFHGAGFGILVDSLTFPTEDISFFTGGCFLNSTWYCAWVSLKSRNFSYIISLISLSTFYLNDFLTSEFLSSLPLLLNILNIIYNCRDQR